ncbi:hypothetical protein G6F57_018287 [Rhizopus arrhizus]|nr:hypothetical protein G6F57_018287 [Rhizopus arrhizus]
MCSCIAQTLRRFLRSADPALAFLQARDFRKDRQEPVHADRLHPRPDDVQALARARLERRRRHGALRAALHGPGASRPTGPPRPLRSEHHPTGQPAVDQDRRLSGGLRVLPAVFALRHRAGRRQADAAGGRGCRRPRRAGRRRAALLHGRRLAQPEAASPGSRGRDGHRGQGAGPGDLRHAGHAARRPG